MDSNVNSVEDQKLQISRTQLRLQIVQVILSTVLVYFIVKNSIKGQNLPDAIIEEEED
jgi:hypothetical protein